MHHLMQLLLIRKFVNVKENIKIILITWKKKVGFSIKFDVVSNKKQ